MFLSIILTLICASRALSDSWIGTCKTSDNKCLMEHLNKLIHVIAGGIPSLGMSSIDPMYQEVVYGNHPNLKFKLTNNTIIGYKKCIKKKFELNLDDLRSHFEMHCPSFTITGYYEMSGELGNLPVKGEGTYKFLTSGYVTKFDEYLEYGTDSDGKKYLIVTDAKVQPKAIGPVKFEFNNLFNGRKDLSDSVIQYANKNWKYVASLFDKPIATENAKIIFNNFNKLLKLVPLESFSVPISSKI